MRKKIYLGAAALSALSLLLIAGVKVKKHFRRVFVAPIFRHDRVCRPA